MRLLPPRGERALPVLAGVLLALAFPPAAFLLPSFVALVPLLVFIAALPPGAAGRWAATRGALVAGGVFYALRLIWIVVALFDRSPLAIPAYALTILLLAALTGAFGAALHLTRERLRLPLPVLAAVLWTAMELIHARLGPFAFPWLPLGSSLAPFPRLAGAADLVGTAGLGLWLAAANGAVASLVLRLRRGRPLAPLPGRTLLAAALLAAPAAYGLVRAATLETRPALRAAVVQPDITQDLKLDPALALDTSLAALAALTATLAGEDLDLVAWPEVALPADLAAGGRLVDTLAGLASLAGAPVLAGAYALDTDGDAVLAYNAAFLVGHGGVLGPRYDKRVLVPFIERVPLLDRLPGRPRRGLERRIGQIRYYGGLGRGDDATLFQVHPAGLATGPVRVGVLICYESAFPRLARQYRRAGADVLVNITNDAWFGREPWWGRTTALWQHPAHIVMRAIETRTGVARAANTGFSLFVDPIGRVHARTRLFEPAVAVATVHTTDSITLFVRWGDWLGTLAGASAAALLAAAWWRGRGRRTARAAGAAGTAGTAGTAGAGTPRWARRIYRVREIDSMLMNSTAC